MDRICVKCKKELLRHSCFMQCSVCYSYVHLSCIPMLSKDDPLYTNRFDVSWICTLCIEDTLPFVHLIDDADFQNCICNDKLPRSNLTIQELNNSLSFTPFELCEDKLSDQLKDVDPDAHFFQSHSQVFSE